MKTKQVKTKRHKNKVIIIMIYKENQNYLVTTHNPIFYNKIIEIN